MGCRPAGAMAVSRKNHTATLLADGRVLVVGGETLSGSDWTTLATAELWDPRTLTFSPAGEMTEGREGHTATLLPDGRVALIGGNGTGPRSGGPLWSASDTVEIWDPATLAFSPAASLTSPRWLHTSTLLDDGSVLVAGGQASDDYVGGLVTATAEIWEP